MPLLGRRSWYNLEKRLVWTLDMLRLIYMHLIACLQIKFAVYVIFYFFFVIKCSMQVLLVDFRLF